MAAIHPKQYVISHLFRFFDLFILIFRDFRRFSHVMMHLEGPEIREDTAGVVYGSHPSKTVCDFAFISIFEYFIVIVTGFKTRPGLRVGYAGYGYGLDFATLTEPVPSARVSGLPVCDPSHL